MKTLLKFSFFPILLIAVFNIGISNAYSEEVRESKIDIRNEIIEATPLQCNKILSADVTMLIDNTEHGSFYLIHYTLNPKCYKVYVYEDGTIIIKPIPCKDDEDK